VGQAYFDLATEDGPLGTLVFGLYGMVVPKTVLNFVGMMRSVICSDGWNVEREAQPMTMLHLVRT
jgi:cyclophilin family peptidyl-prolyl cis-trans isomerase